MVPEFDLTGKVALITGAGRGIGAGIAEVFAEAGCDVAINALTDRFAGPRAQQIAAATGRRVIVLTGDMTAFEEASATVQRCIEQLGGLDILVNGLGDSIKGPLAALPDGRGGDAMTTQDVEHVLDLNLTSALHCLRAAGSHLTKVSGKVINVSGYAGVKGQADHGSVYAAAKAGLIGLTRSVAMDWAPYGVQVNCIAPGSMPDAVTVGRQGVDERQAAAEEGTKIPLRRVGRPREVGLLALYLAAPASDYMTGQTLNLDGGITA